MLKQLELLIATVIIVLFSLFIIKEGFELQNYVEGIMENINEHNRQLEMVIDEIEE